MVRFHEVSLDLRVSPKDPRSGPEAKANAKARAVEA